MRRDDALELVRSKVGNPNLVKHMRATEAVMTALATRLGQDPAAWGLAGLLHDIDLGEATPPDRHGERSVEILHEAGFDDPEVCEAIAAHSGRRPRMTPMARALFAADPLTGLIVAAALVSPERKLAAITPENVLNRYREKHFARGARREDIATCSELGIELPEFVALGLGAMQAIADEIGLG